MKKIGVKLLYSTDKDTFGFKEYQITNKNIDCYSFYRYKLDALKKLNVFNRSGIYFLVNKKESLIYIGQSDDIQKRLLEHGKNEHKDQLDEAYAFCSNTTSDFSKTIINALEHHYISKFQKSYWNCINKIEPSSPKLSKFEENDILDFIETIDQYLIVTNLLEDTPTTLDNNNNKDIENDIDVFYCAQAQLIYRAGKFILLKDSILNYSKIKNHFDSEKRKKEANRIVKWIEDAASNKDLLLTEDNNAILQKDMRVNSPSLAGCLAKGHYAVNGWESWKTKDGETLNEKIGR